MDRTVLAAAPHRGGNRADHSSRRTDSRSRPAGRVLTAVSLDDGSGGHERAGSRPERPHSFAAKDLHRSHMTILFCLAQSMTPVTASRLASLLRVTAGRSYNLLRR